MVMGTSRRTAVSLLLILLIVVVHAQDQFKSINTSSLSLALSQRDQIEHALESCDVVQQLSAAKVAAAGSTSSVTKRLFNILFPSSKPWLNSILATAYISGPPNFLLALCPPNIDPNSLQLMVAFAVGGLLGDTFFHLLPEIFLGEDESDKARFVLVEPNRNLLLGVFILVGLATFMAMDKALRIATGGSGHGHSHSHKHDTADHHDQSEQAHRRAEVDYRLEPDLAELARKETREEQQQRLYEKPYNDTLVEGVKIKDIVSQLAETNVEIRRRHRDSRTDHDRDINAGLTSGADTNKHDAQLSPDKSRDLGTTPEDSFNEYKERQNKRGDTPDDTAVKSSKVNPSTKLSALLNLFADFTHNITDGLALSSSFYASPTLGATTTMAVFFHEIPHEVGDFALLIQAGYSKRDAMLAQFVTAVGAFLGVFIGIFVNEFGAGNGASGNSVEGLLGTSLTWGDALLPFTAGTFMYVGTVGVIPELLETGSDKGQEVVKMLTQFAAMALGAAIMILISWS